MAGCSYGYSAVLLAQHASFVHCFEPNPKVLPVLAANLLTNNVTNVKVYPLALYRSSATVRLSVNFSETYKGMVSPLGIPV